MFLAYIVWSFGDLLSTDGYALGKKLLIFSKRFFHFAIVFNCTINAKRFRNKANEMYLMFCIKSSMKSAVLDLTWYYETESITQKQQNSRIKYSKRVSTCNLFLLRIENVNKYDSVEFMQRSGWPCTSLELKNDVSNYFNRYFTRSTWIAETDPLILHTVIQRILQKESVSFRIV